MTRFAESDRGGNLLRHDHRTRRARTTRTMAAGVPAALAGSIALVLSGAPANAAERRAADERMLRALPAVRPIAPRA